MTRVVIAIIVSLGILGCGGPVGTPDAGIPRIVLSPKDARPMVASDFFDGCRLVTFKGVLCTQLGDLIEVGDKFLVSNMIIQRDNSINLFGMFDSAGNLLNKIGEPGRGAGEYFPGVSHVIELVADTTIVLKWSLGFWQYDLKGKLLRREDFQGLRELGNIVPVRYLNDSLLLFKVPTHIVSAIPPGSEAIDESSRKLHVVSADGSRLKRSFLPLYPFKDYLLRDQEYVVNDTFCYYSDAESCIYSVTADTAVPRYMLDKGKYTRLTTQEQFVKEGHSPVVLYMGPIAENSTYVMGKYLLDETYYFFFYDKRSGTTHNLKTRMEDSVLFERSVNVDGDWRPGYQVSDDYMYFYFTPTKFAKLVEGVREKLGDGEWEAYRQRHPDLMEMYDGLSDESSTVVIGYHFKR